MSAKKIKNTKYIPKNLNSVVLSYTGTENNEFLPTGYYDQLQINDCLQDVCDVKFSVEFKTPKNVLFYPQIMLGLENQPMQPVDLCIDQDGKYLTGDLLTPLNTITQIVSNLYDICILHPYNAVFSFNEQQFTNTGKLTLKCNKQFKFQIIGSVNDKKFDLYQYYFAKVVGAVQDFEESIKQKQYVSKLYIADLVNEVQFSVSFEKASYCRIAKTLNIICTDIMKYNFYENKQKRYIALKSQYNFDPGNNCQADSSFSVQMSTDQLSNGLHIEFQDENFQQIIFDEDSEYKLTLYVETNQAIISRNNERLALQQQEEQLEADEEKQKIEAANLEVERQQIVETNALKDGNQILTQITNQEQEDTILDGDMFNEQANECLLNINLADSKIAQISSMVIQNNQQLMQQQKQLNQQLQMKQSYIQGIQNIKQQVFKSQASQYQKGVQQLLQDFPKYQKYINDNIQNADQQQLPPNEKLKLLNELQQQIDKNEKIEENVKNTKNIYEYTLKPVLPPGEGEVMDEIFEAQEQRQQKYNKQQEELSYQDLMNEHNASPDYPDQLIQMNQRDHELKQKYPYGIRAGVVQQEQQEQQPQPQIQVKQQMTIQQVEQEARQIASSIWKTRHNTHEQPQEDDKEFIKLYNQGVKKAHEVYDIIK